MIRQYFAHILKLIAKRKKPIILFIACTTCFLIFYKDFHEVVYQQNHVFNQSIYYCNKPHHVSGNENSVSKLDSYKLRQIQILIRHGDRAPIDLKALPNIAPVFISCMFNKTEDLFLGELNRYREIVRKNLFYLHGNKYDRLLDERFVCKGGQLTPYGFLQHLYLGGYLQNSYKEFLENVDIFEDIWIQSTNVQRTIQSAAALMTGIFYDRLINLSKDDKVGINIFQDKYSDTHFLLDHNFKNIDCSPLKVALKQHKQNRTNSLHFQDYGYLSNSFSEILSTDRRHIPPINRIADVLYTKLCHGQGVPYGPHAKIPSHLVEKTFRNADVFFSEKSAYAPEMQTLSLLSQIAWQWHKLSSNEGGKDNKKLVLYSGHDSMITPFLVLLGVNDGKWPPYASRVIFEFYQKKDKFNSKSDDVYFRVLFNGQVMKNIKFCTTRTEDGELCHVSNLYRYVSNERYNGDSSEKEFHISTLFERIYKLCKKPAMDR